jgi:hypothetical protein
VLLISLFLLSPSLITLSSFFSFTLQFSYYYVYCLPSVGQGGNR